MPLFGEPGQRIGYEVHAHPDGAPPIFLIHGFTASGASFSSNVEGLAERFTVVTVDLLGHGASDAPADAALYEPEPAVERISGLVQHLGYHRVLVCGHSLGGAVAIRLALDHPERVAALVVINSNSAAGSVRWREEAQPRLDEMARRIRAEGTGFLRDTRLYPARSQRLPADARAALTRDFDRLTPEGVAGTAEGLIAKVNASDRLAEIVAPTLIVIGDRDAEFVQNAGNLIAGLREPVVQVLKLEGAGHAANLEQPAEFNAAVVQFAEDIGYIEQVKRKRDRRMMAVLIGGSLVVAAGAFLAAVMIAQGADDDDGEPLPVSGLSPVPSLPNGSPSPSATETSNAGAEVTPSPPPTETPTAEPTATETPTEAPTSGPSPAPTNTPVRTNTPTPTRTPTPQPTPTPTSTPTPTATPTPTPTPSPTPIPGPTVTVGGSTFGSPGVYTFFASVPATDPLPQQIVLSVTGPGINVSRTGGATRNFGDNFTLSEPGTYVVTASAVFDSESATDSLTVTITEPP